MSDLYTEIVNTTRALIIVLDAKGRIVTFNPACERASGYRFEEVQGLPIWDFLLLPEEIDGVKAVFAELRAGQFPNTHENHWLTKPGERRFIEWSNSAVTDESGRVVHVIGAGIDVTENRAADLVLLKAGQRQRTLLDSLPDATWLKDENGIYIEINDAATGRHGLAAADVIGKSDFDIFPPGIARKWVEEDRQVMSARERMRFTRHSTVEDKPCWIDTIKVPVIDQAGNVIGTAGVARDITDIKRVEQMLHEIQQRQRALLDSIPDAAWLMDADEKYIEINRNYAKRCECWGIDPSDIIGKTASEILPAPIAEENIAENREIIRTGKPLHVEKHRAIGGRDYWFEVIKTPVTDEAGNVTGIAGVARDINERKLAEAQRIARDATLRAALVKEVHHRIKNNLQGVIALMQQLETGTAEGTALLDAVVARVNTIASVHGLYGAIGERELHLEQILLTLVSSLKTLYTDLPVRLSMRNNPQVMLVTAGEIVPLALIINELIMNAIKHSRGIVDGKPVEIALEATADRARIIVRNPAGRLPDQFNFDTGAGIGTGLALVKALLPPAGAALRFENAGDPAEAKAELTLYPPVIVSPSLKRHRETGH